MLLVASTSCFLPTTTNAALGFEQGQMCVPCSHYIHSQTECSMKQGPVTVTTQNVEELDLGYDTGPANQTHCFLPSSVSSMPQGTHSSQARACKREGWPSLL